MHKYGSIYRTCDFIERLISRRPNEANLRHAFDVMCLIKKLEEHQQNNQNITLNIHARDGIWVSYKGSYLCLIIPAQKGLRLFLGTPFTSEAKKLAKIAGTNEPTGYFSPRHVNKKQHYKQWQLKYGGYKILENYVGSLSSKISRSDAIRGRHPRNFPGDVRRIALEIFEDEGRWCPGVKGKTKRHKLTKVDQIEFDHVLPYAKGGPSSALNIQVLCVTCNRKKRNSAS